MNALLKPFNVFLRLESTAGLLLFLMAIIAIVIANTTYADAYHHFFEQPVALSFQTHVFTKSVLFWINDIFMALFFLLVGLEIKNEMIDGALNTAKKAALPAIAAIGGMFVPALIYVLINHSIAAYLQGWAIPTATDIAFSLAILSLFGKRIPIGLKIFLTALAIFDDIGAILIIAVYYHSHISLYIVGVVACLLITFLLNITRCYYFFLYALLGIALWICLYQSGIHPTITGVLLSFALPYKNHSKHSYAIFKLERGLHPWIAFFILPLFAFANAGIGIMNLSLNDFTSPVTLGVLLGLCVGKPIGIWMSTFISVKSRVAALPKDVNFFGIYSIAQLAGVGFTMSLFIGALAFHQSALLLQAKLGVIVASMLSGIIGAFALFFV